MQPDDITYFAKTNFRGQDTVFGIKTDDRRRHMYIIGKTGMGKTNLLEHLVLQDIRNGHGVAYVDPHGDTAEKLIRMIPPERIKDVIYFNPADQDFPIAFNVMEQVDPEFRHLVSSGLVGVFKKLWADSWGPRLEYVLRNAILALLECPGSTLLGVMRILVDKKYRVSVVNQLTDPVIKSFWVDEFTKWSDKVLQEVVSPIQNKVGQFLSTSLIRNIVGQMESSFSIREAMDSNKIIILNLAKGRIGEDNSAMLGAMMVTKIQMAAMARVDMAEEDRKDFYLYVDEFQNFATEAFANILSEARKYRLNLVLANQYVTQIDEIVRDAVFGNAGTLIAFRVGAMDAEFLEKEFEPVFMMNDVVNLPKYNIYLKLMIDGIAGDAFSATTLPPIEAEGVDNSIAEKVINASRERYTASKVAVEQGIRDWSGVFAPVTQPMPAQPVTSDKGRGISEGRTQDARHAEVGQGARRKAQGTEDGKWRMENREGRRENGEQKMENKNPIPTSNFPASPAGRQLPNSHTQISSPTIQAPAFNIQIPNSKFQIPNSAPKDDRVWYDALCDTCGLKIQLPFVPDGRRPAFCKECLKEYQRKTAKQPSSSSSQSQSVSPKTSQPVRKRSEPDVVGIKELLQKAQRNGESS